MTRVVRALAVLAATLGIQVTVAGCGGAFPVRSDRDAAATGSEGRWQRITVAARRARGFQGLVPVLVGDKVVVISGVDYHQATVKGLVIDLSSRRSSLTAPSRRRPAAWNGSSGMTPPRVLE